MNFSQGQDNVDINAICACFNLRKATRALTQYFDRCLEETGIRATQFSLLVSLHSGSEKTITDLADRLVMDRTTLTRNIKPLENKGLVRALLSSDKRSKAFALTDTGRLTIEQAIPLWEQAQQKVMQGLGDDDFKQLLQTLNAIVRMFEAER